MSLMPRITIAIAVLLVSVCVGAGAQADLTGVHKAQAICDRDNSSIGPAYMAPCYEGHKYQLGTQYTLIQNGPYVCGSFQACGGFNCGKLYAGEVVGIVRGDKVTLYSADGHQEEGEANVEVFRVSKRGELLIPDSGKRAYMKTSPGVITAEEKSSCQPQFNEPVRLKDYELEVQGASVNLEKFAPPEKPTYRSPREYLIELKNTTDTLSVQDGTRPHGNLIPRTVRIHNATNKPWTISAESPSFEDEDLSCPKWLEMSEKKSDSYVWAYDKNYPTKPIPPKSTRYTRICAGDTLNLEKVLPECPKFQCLRTCRC